MGNEQTQENSIITVSHLVKKYNDVVAVNDISFEVKSGEVFGILGPNGAGKTSTLEMIEGLSRITSGEIRVDGIDVSRFPAKVKEIVGIQLQANSFFEKLSLIELLQVFGSFYSHAESPLDLLTLVELEEKKNATIVQLSGGQQQRFSIAASLVNNPKILFLDEPTTGLDPQSRRHMWELVQRIHERGHTIILTTHYMEEAELLCQRIAIMDAGKIVKLDTPDRLIQELLDKGFKKRAQERLATLEDVFIDLTGRNLRD